MIPRMSLHNVAMDIHILAYTYHWSRESLWDMTRSERTMWVKLVQMQKQAESNALNNSSNKGYSPSAYRESI